MSRVTQSETELGSKPGQPNSRALTLVAMSKASALRQEGESAATGTHEKLRDLDVRMNQEADDVERASRKR